MVYRYATPLPDQRADLLWCARADQSSADELATVRWLAEPTWPERMTAAGCHVVPDAARDCQP
jgi:hypothetical protein